MLTLKPRKFSHLKLMLILIFALNFDIYEEPTIYHQYFTNDLVFCPECFEIQTNNCAHWLNKMEYDTDSTVHNFINAFPKGIRREVQLLQMKTIPEYKLVGKYFGRNTDQLRALQFKLSTEELANIFLDEERVGGIQYCPSKTIKRFVDTLSVKNTFLTELSVWLYLIINAEPVLLPYLDILGFPVPPTFAVCGFSMFQQYGGKSLVYYYKAPILLRIRIAQLLLHAAFKFTKGNQGFHFYITDMTADNIVYYEFADELYFVDVDTMFVVDASQTDPPPQFNITHRHQYIECNDCFAFSHKDLCAHHLSDINLFAACQFLREDLKRNRAKGFLAGIPHDILDIFPQLPALLNMCVDCGNETCDSRSITAISLIEVMKSILVYFKFF